MDINSNKKGRIYYKKILYNIGNLISYRIISLTISAIYILLNLYLITGMQEIVDTISKGHDITNLIKRFIIVLLIYFAMTYISQYKHIYFSLLVKNKVLAFLYEKLLSKNIRFFTDKNKGNLNSLLVNDGDKIAVWICYGWQTRIVQLFTLISTLYLMLKYSIILTIIILITILVCFIGINRISILSSKNGTEYYKILGKVNDSTLETIDNMNLIKLLRKENYFNENFKDLLFVEKHNNDKKRTHSSSLFMTVTITLMFSIPFLAIALGAILASKGSMTIGGVIAFYALSGQLQEPIRLLSESLTDEKTTMELAYRLKVILDEDVDNGIETIDGFKDLKIDIEKYNYGDKDILKDLKLNIKSKDIIVLKGESGSGKTTLINLILGILELENGSIKVNNSDIKNIDKDSLWKYILNQGQEHLILEGSLYENLTLGDSYTDEEINKAISIACLDDFVSEYGLDREFEESGKNLSGGQKQRINLARVLLRKPELLILDEPTSALDNETSNMITKNIVDFSKENNTGLIVISHRDDFDSYADEIIQLRV